MERGDETEENAGRDREEEGKGEDAPVDAQIEEERDLGRQAEVAHGVVDERGEPDARSAAGERDDEALGEQLPNEPAAAGANREPDRDFLAALGGARQEQVGEIHAGEQQDERAD